MVMCFSISSQCILILILGFIDENDFACYCICMTCFGTVHCEISEHNANYLCLLTDYNVFYIFNKHANLAVSVIYEAVAEGKFRQILYVLNYSVTKCCFATATFQRSI